MLAAKLFGAGDLRLVECDIPPIADDEILLKVGAAAICGTDLRMIANGSAGVDEKHPRTLGHEVSGVIERVGSRVHEFSPGQRIALAPNIGCGTCDMCVSGNTHLCGRYQALGVNLDGAFAQYMRIPADAVTQGNIVLLDPQTPLEEASLYEPMACVMNGQSRVRVRVNETVLVIGAGPIGIMHAMLAKASGASQVMIRDLNRARVEQCVAVKSYITPLYGDDLLEEVLERTGGRGVDVCITACPSAEAQAQSLKLMATNGRVLFFGGLPQGKDNVLLHTNLIHYRQLGIHGSTRGNVHQYRSVAQMAEAQRFKLAPLISRRFPLSQIQEAVSYAGSAQGLKTVITF